jgi:hypothetical protein
LVISLAVITIRISVFSPNFSFLVNIVTRCSAWYKCSWKHQSGNKTLIYRHLIKGTIINLIIFSRDRQSYSWNVFEWLCCFGLCQFKNPVLDFFQFLLLPHWTTILKPVPKSSLPKWIPRLNTFDHYIEYYIWYLRVRFRYKSIVLSRNQRSSPTHQELIKSIGFQW